MSLGSKTIAFNTGTGTSPVSVNGFGFKPRSLRVDWGGQVGTSDVSGRLSQDGGHGLAVPGDQRCVVAHSTDAANPTQCQQGIFDDRIVSSLNGSGTVVGKATILSWDDDGVTFDISSAFATNLEIRITAWGGPDLDQAKIVTTTAEPGSTGLSDTTNVGFAGDFFQVIGMSGVSSFSSPSQIATNSSIYCGFATRNRAGTINQAVLSCGAKHNVATTASSNYCRQGDFIARLDSNCSTTIESRAVFNAVLSNGFQLNWVTVNAAATRVSFVLVMKGGNWDVLGFTVPANTSTDMVLATGFKPDGAMFISSGRTVTPTAGTGSGAVNTFMGTSVGTAAQISHCVRDGSATTGAQTTVATNHSNCLFLIVTGSTSPSQALNTTAFGPNSITCRLTISTASQIQGMAVAWGSRALGLPPQSTYSVPSAQMRGIVQSLRSPRAYPVAAATTLTTSAAGAPTEEIPGSAGATAIAVPAGAPSTEAPGAASAVALAVTAPAGGPSEERPGSPSAAATNSPAGQPTTESPGAASAVVGGVVTIAASAPSTEAAGATVSIAATSAVGRDSEEFPGAASVVTTGATLAPAGQPSAESAGAASAATTPAPTGKPTDERSGATTSAATASPAGLPSAEAPGATSATASTSPAATPSTETPGAASALAGVATVQSSGEPSRETPGATAAAAVASPVGGRTEEVAGAASVVAGLVINLPVGAPSTESPGAVIQLVTAAPSGGRNPEAPGATAAVVTSTLAGGRSEERGGVAAAAVASAPPGGPSDERAGAALAAALATGTGGRSEERAGAGSVAISTLVILYSAGAPPEERAGAALAQVGGTIAPWLAVGPGGSDTFSIVFNTDTHSIVLPSDTED